MKKINENEMKELQFRPMNYTRRNKVVEFAKTLEVGESFIFAREEWARKGAPSQSYSVLIPDGRKFTTKRLLDGSGWVTTRIK